MNLSLRALCLLLLAFGIACGDDSRPTDSGVRDAASDASQDRGVDEGVADGGVDTGVDTGVDLSVDEGVDAPPLTPVSLYTELTERTDDELAEEALQILGYRAPAPQCTQCHGFSRDRVRTWGTDTVSSLECIGELNPNEADDAEAILDCFGGEDLDVVGMGLLTTTLHLEWFTRVFDVRFGEDARPEHTAFRDIAQMPKSPGFLLSQDNVDVLLTWAGRGTPGLERIREGGGLECTDEVRRGMLDHIDAMETGGWATLNREADVAMFGCDSDVAADCLADYPLAETFEDGQRWSEGGVGKLRVLFDYPYRSSFWTRSSADGRYVSHGGAQTGRGSTIIDLRREVLIPASAQYDPGFFPDNSGFVIQSAGFCPQSLLDSEPDRVTFGEAGCADLDSVGLYQHMAASPGGDYWTVFGQFVSDNGDFGAGSALPVTFDESSSASFVPIIYDGTTYRARDAVDVSIPFEGDTVISPSGLLAISRMRGVGGQQSGFSVRAVQATRRGASYRIEAPTVANYCVRGSKPFFSYDEEWLTYHRYVLDEDAEELGFDGPSDPDFAAYRATGAANTYLLHLPTGREERLTFMEPGQFALFPHFRSDGWIYIVVRDTRGPSTREYIVASDAFFVER